jgi:16S rRNA (guanine966-N2)-methyltransferase
MSSLESRLGGLLGVRVLDLYAGSGAIGLEAASRGAGAVTLVEHDRQALAVLRSNVDAVGVGEVRVAASDVVRWLSTPCPDPASAYEVVFLDPPYDLPAVEVGRVLTMLGDGGWLTDQATVVVERPRREIGWIWPLGYEPERERRYGETVLRSALWYRRRDDESGE